MTHIRQAARARQRGAALLVGMIILTLITTLVAGMVWQQWRGIQVEAAERARTQSAWVLTGALDYARLILKEDGKGSKYDHLGEPWAVPLAEARLSSFLAADKDNNADEGGGPDAFLSGSITDLQSRFNLTNLVAGVGNESKPQEKEVNALRRLCEFINVPASTAQRIVDGLQGARAGSSDAAIEPKTVEQLVWLGVDANDLKRLAPFVTFLPEDAKTVNVNTAPKEVIAAVVDGITTSDAERLVQSRQREPLKEVQNAAGLLPQNVGDKLTALSVDSHFFEVQGQVRLGDRVLQERSIVRRNGNEPVAVLRRERVNLVTTNP